MEIPDQEKQTAKDATPAEAQTQAQAPNPYVSKTQVDRTQGEDTAGEDGPSEREGEQSYMDHERPDPKNLQPDPKDA